MAVWYPPSQDSRVESPEASARAGRIASVYACASKIARLHAAVRNIQKLLHGPPPLGELEEIRSPAYRT